MNELLFKPLAQIVNEQHQTARIFEKNTTLIIVAGVNVPFSKPAANVKSL